MFNIYSKKFFNPKRAWIWLLISFCFVVVAELVIKEVNDIIKTTYDKSILNKLEFYYKAESPNRMETLCIISNCYAIVENKKDGVVLYTRENESSKLIKHDGHVTIAKLNEIRSGLPKKFIVEDLAIYSKEVLLKDVTEKYINIITIILSIAFFFIFFTLTSYLWLKNNYKQRELKENLEDHIQKGLTESLHHEIGNPVQGLWNIFLDYVTGLYPCYVLNGFQDVDAKECKVCGGKKHKTPSPDVIEMIKYMQLNFSRINSVLRILSKSKNIKYSHESICLEELLQLTIASKEKLHISKVKITLENSDILSDVYLDNDFENGLFVNIINSLLTNSIEACANMIEIKPKFEGSETLHLFIKDNGHGVLDKDNNLFNSNAIFKYGYSSKDEAYNRRQTTWFTKFKNRLFCWDDCKTSRGFGLSINRDILKNYDGSLILYDNSHYGATFRITLKIKKGKK